MQIPTHGLSVGSRGRLLLDKYIVNLPYTYFIRNRITGQFYYGSRCKNVALNRSAKADFWIHYFTSSKKVKSLIMEYGKDSFDFEIIMESETFDDCYWKEQELISSTISDSLSLNGYFVDKIYKSEPEH